MWGRVEFIQSCPHPERPQTRRPGETRRKKEKLGAEPEFLAGSPRLCGAACCFRGLCNTMLRTAGGVGCTGAPTEGPYLLAHCTHSPGISEPMLCDFPPSREQFVRTNKSDEQQRPVTIPMLAGSCGLLCGIGERGRRGLEACQTDRPTVVVNPPDGHTKTKSP